MLSTASQPRSAASTIRAVSPFHPRWKMAWRCVPLAVLAACGGGKDDDEGNVDVKGVLVAPSNETVTEPTTPASGSTSGRAAPNCPDVPQGYDPLANVQVDFKDPDGKVVFKLTTNQCGQFAGAVPKKATTAHATTEKTGPVSQPVSTLTKPKPTVVSCAPKDAQLVISVIQYLGEDKIALTVTDSITHKAVLGLTADNFAFTYNEASALTDSVSYGADEARKPARVGLVLDSSGSMNTPVGETGKNRNQVAALAAHQLLNGLHSGSDEVGTVVFGENVKVINDEVLGSLNWVDAAGAPTAKYSFSPSGWTSNIKAMRPLIDIYNQRSKIHVENKDDPAADKRHPDSGELSVLKSDYAVGGNTAFYNAVSAGLSMLDIGKTAATEEGQRKILVNLTDGQDNKSGGKALDTVIGEAKDKKVPLYTVAFGRADEVNEAAMQRMAKETGGEYKRTEDLNLTRLFQGIQTGISYQYLADMKAAPNKGSLVRATVSRAGSSASRDLKIAP